MTLNEKEKEFIQLLKKWSQEGKVLIERDEVIKDLDVDPSECKSVIKKFEEIGAVYNVAQGMGQEYGEFFKIRDPCTLQDLWRMIEDEQKQ